MDDSSGRSSAQAIKSVLRLLTFLSALTIAFCIPPRELVAAQSPDTYHEANHTRPAIGEDKS